MLRRPLLSREHGSWAMLLMPYIIGVAVAGALNWQALLFLVSILALFCARYTLSLLARRGFPAAGDPATRSMYWWMAIYSSIALIGGAGLLVDRRLMVLLGVLSGLLLVANIYLLRRKLDRSAWSELLGIAGLSMSAPGAYYAATGDFGYTAVSLWVLTFLYSGSSVFYVRVKLWDRQSRSNAERQRKSRRALFFYQGVLFIAVVALAVAGLIPFLALVAFVPLLYKVFRAVTGPRAQMTLRQVGLVELGHSVVFATLLVLAFRLGTPILWP